MTRIGLKTKLTTSVTLRSNKRGSLIYRLFTKEKRPVKICNKKAIKRKVLR